jgi:DNA repair protein RadC
VAFNLNGNNPSSRLKDLAAFERPREKARAIGVKQLSNKELLAIVIRTGTKGQSVLELAESIMNTYGSMSHVVRVPYHEWLEHRGISHVKAIELMAIFELFQRIEKEGVERISFKEPMAIYRHFRLRLGTLNHEQLLVIKLNHRLQYVGESLLRIGSQATLHLDVRDIFVDLLKSDTKKFVLLHNHPSGDVTPSQEDIQTTAMLVKAASELGFKLIDHIIIGLHGYFSLKEHRLV